MDGRLIINNKRIETSEKIASLNPATLESIGDAYLASKEVCQEAVLAAKRAFPLWRSRSFDEKKKIFKQAKKILLRRCNEAAHLITVEKGSPLPESLSVEVLGCLEALDFYAHHLKNTLRPKKVKSSVPFFSHKKNFFQFQPLGITLIISPWNFPFLIPSLDILSSLVAGNVVILRPSTTTPFTALLIGEIFLEAGLPPGVLNIVNCRVPQAEGMVTNPDIQTVLFTGSVNVGKRIMELGSRNLTNTILELGGKDPMIVLKDADLERAARGAVWAGYMNCGQSCASIERVYVAKEVVDEFLNIVLALTKELKVGNPLETDVDMGPMANLSQLQIVEDHIQDARAKGAQVLYGGKKLEGFSGYFLEPTVLSEVNHSMKIMKEETFGPVLPIMVFSEPEEAVSLANDSQYGLTASVWTRNKKMACWVAQQIEVGSVTVNDHMFSFTEPKAIWGGIKQTGLGRSHGPYGLEELVNIKFTSLDFLKKKSQLWWYPYSMPKPLVIEQSLILLHHERLKEKIKAVFLLLPHWPTVQAGTPFRDLIKIGSRFFRK
jgi:acyl-CoA reductase-like NAD-dependent aldehyde dehydrogenase